MAAEQIIDKDLKPKAGLGEFVRETRREIAKVTWPTRAEVGTTTAMIVALALVGGIFFLAVDSALGYIVSRLLGMSGS